MQTEPPSHNITKKSRFNFQAPILLKVIWFQNVWIVIVLKHCLVLLFQTSSLDHIESMHRDKRAMELIPP